MHELAGHDPNGDPRQAWNGWKKALLILLIATGLAFLFAGQMYLSAAAYNRHISWGQALYWSFGDWYEWALLTPLIFWLCRRFRFDRRSWRGNLFAHLFAGLILAAMHAVLCACAAIFQGWVTGLPKAFGEELGHLLANRLHYNLAVYAVIACSWHAWDYYQKFREREAQAAELASRLAEAQLRALRMQLNPHFLFNTLNAVSSLMLKDVNAANKMVCRLGDLLRVVLENTDRQEVPLDQEIEFLRRYLEIEQIRFGDRLQLRMDVDPATLNAAVPNLILQPLVENAIRYAVEPQEDVGEIELRASRDNGSLLLQVSDNGAGDKSGPLDEGAPSGREQIGLRNTRERLRKLYGDRQKFQLVRNARGGITASLTIPFHVASPVSA